MALTADEGAASIEERETKRNLLPTSSPKEESFDENLQHESFGYMLLLLSALGYCMLGLFIRMATGYHGFPVPCYLVIRGIMQSSFALSWIALTTDFKATLTVSLRSLFYLFLHALGAGTSLSFGFYGLSLVPFGIANCIFFLNPIFTMMFSSLLLSEPFGAAEIGAAVTSFIGIVLVSNPRLRFDFAAGEAPGYATGCFFALVSAFAFAQTCILVRAASKLMHFMMFVLAMGVGAGVFGVALGGVSLTAMTRDPVALVFVLIGCMGGMFGTACLNKALGYCRAGTGTLLRTIDVPIAYVLGVVVLGEIPHVVSIIGSALVVGSTCVVALQSVVNKNVSEEASCEAPQKR